MERYCYKCERDVELIKDPNSNAQVCSLCGAVIIHSANYLPPGTMLGGFRIVDELGRGGMGIVYRARQLNLERDVALKVLADDLANDREFVNRFFKEARAAASLNHPNIVQVFDAGRSPEGISFFAMELIEGETLESRIENNAKLSPEEALKVAVQIADALDYAWKSQKLTHGDIKPDNIILNHTGGAKLADLGLAKFVYDETSDDGIMATPLYAPPEVIRGDIALIGFRSDMYSFGATLYQMLAGVPPFPDNAPEIVFQQHLNDTPSSLHHHNDRLSPALVQICEQLLEKDPERRPAAWEDVHTALKNIDEPEVAGKIFHTHMHSGQELSDTDQESSLLSMMIKGLVALLVVLVVAVLAVMFVDFDGNKAKGKKTVIADPELLARQWKSLKQDISKAVPETALEKVRLFISEHDNNVPEDVSTVLKKLEAKVASVKKNRKRRAAEQAKFDTSVNAVVTFLKSTDIKSKDTPIADIQKLHAQIKGIFRKASDISYLIFPEGTKELITGAYKDLSARLLAYKQKMEKIRNEKIARMQLEKLHEEQADISQKISDYDVQVSLNSAVNNYYTALSDFNEVKKISTLKSGLIKWDQDSDVVAPQYSIRVEFLTAKVLPVATNIYRLIKSKEPYFKGKPLPPEMCPGKLKYYTVKSFTDKGIKLAYNNNSKVTLGHTVLWSAISHKDLIRMVKERLFSTEDVLTDEEKKVVLSFALLYSLESFPEIFEKVQNLSKRERQCWKSVKKDFETVEREVKCITLYNQVCEARDSEKYADAAVLLHELAGVSRGTVFRSRYAKILPHFSEQLSKYSPVLTALDFIDKLSYKEKPESQFNAAMVLYARYSGCLLQADENTVKKLAAIKRRSTVQLVRNSGVKHLSDNRIPFYYWAKEKQGASQAFLDIVERSGKLKSMPAVIRMMKLSTALDNGDWPTIQSMYTSKGSVDFSRINVSSKIRPWLTSFLFAYGMADFQFGNGSERQRIKQWIEQQSSLFKTGVMAPLVLSLIIEYDLMIRNRAFPVAVASRYNYKSLSSYAMSAKVGLLGLLACVENRKSQTSQFQFLSSRLCNVYRNDPHMLGDLKFVAAAGTLFKNSPLSQAQISGLMHLKCSYPDASARILLSALARYHAMNGESFKNEDKLITLLESKVTPLVISGDLWRKVVLFKMADRPYAGDIKRIADEALNRTEICTTRFYPGLLILKAGAEFMLGNYSRKDVKTFLTRYYEASSLVSQEDIQALDVITNSDPSLMIASLFKKHQPEKAFRYGILGIMVHCKESVIKSKIIKVMNSNNSSLCWEEQYLMNQVRNWR